MQPTGREQAPRENPMAQTSTIHVTRTGGVCGGRPRIAGHRIRVIDVVLRHERLGQSTDEIPNEFPGIGLADVYGALAYYYDHRAEMDADLSRDEERLEQYRRLFPSRLREKMDGADNPVLPG